MKILVAYFSLSGNTKNLANAIAKHTEFVQLHEIELEKKWTWKGFWSMFGLGFQMFFKIKVPIKKDNLNLNDYDYIFLGMPIWMDNAPSAVLSFIGRHQKALTQKPIGIFATYNESYNHFFESVKNALQTSDLEGTLAVRMQPKEEEEVTERRILQFLTAAFEDKKMVV